MPKVSDSFFNALSWRSVSAILICFMALVAYTPDIPPVNPLWGHYVAPQDESGVPEPLRGRVLTGNVPITISIYTQPIPFGIRTEPPFSEETFASGGAGTKHTVSSVD